MCIRSLEMRRDNTSMKRNFWFLITIRAPAPVMKFIFGKKIQMSQVFASDGRLVPVTVVLALPCVVTQVKTAAHDNHTALQVGFDENKIKHIAKPQRGHLKDLPPLRQLREVGVEQKEIEGIERGDMITVETFTAGDTVDVVGTSKGKGFQGVVKRHHFRGGPASHGHKDNLRMPGSIGAGGVQRVFKGMRMGGHMGDETVTIKHLSVVSIDPEQNILHIKGALPGARNGLVFIKGAGALKVTKRTSGTPAEQTDTQEIYPATEAPAATANATEHTSNQESAAVTVESAT